MEKLKNLRQAEEIVYMDKLKQLQKYIEPLSRMINKVIRNLEVLNLGNARWAWNHRVYNA